VIDERPYQEAAARALKVKLDVITLSGASFADDVMKLMYFQDQPVIGAAMLPMYYVSRLASQHVKVCLGGQAADEVFGGYARYALAWPSRALGSIARSYLRRLGRRAEPTSGGAQVGGNLAKQLGDARNLRRVASNLRALFDWKRGYFENFAQVPEKTWRRVLDPALVSRARAYDVYSRTIDASPAREPFDKVMHWDVQTYLPGLFQQDDRMSMANGLESRVPIADRLLVEFAFRCGPDVKLRDGASKWVLRQAVADVTPDFVLNRRKVGFDTPAATWMRGEHRNFVRDLLLSTRARSRGWFAPREVERLLDDDGGARWFDVAWKLLSIEAWARVHLDASPGEAIELPPSLARGAA
jgi:asparagine synthase (glutamine-hydrolysing)